MLLKYQQKGGKNQFKANLLQLYYSEGLIQEISIKYNR